MNVRGVTRVGEVGGVGVLIGREGGRIIFGSEKIGERSLKRTDFWREKGEKKEKVGKGKEQGRKQVRKSRVKGRT